MTLLLRLARRFFRDVPVMRSVVAASVVSFFVLGANVFLDSQALTGSELSDHELGGYAARYAVDATIPLGWSPSRAPADAVRAEIPDANTMITTEDLPVFEIADDGMAYLEADWSTSLAARYRLDRGRWPDRPGEVVMVGEEAREAGLGGTLTVLGQGRITVVGAAENRYVRQSALLAAPGTWARFEAPDDVDLAQVTGKIVVYLPGTDDGAGSVLPAIDRALDEVGVDTGADGNAGRLERRGDVAQRAPEAWIARSPLLFWMPSLLIVPMTVMLTFMTQFRRLVPAARNLHRAGTPTWTAVTAPWIPTFVLCVVGCLVGGVAGLAGGVAIAELAAGTLAAPMPSFRPPVPGAVALVVGLAVGAAASLWTLRSRVVPRRRPRRNSRPATGSSVSRARRVRHGLLLLVACALVYWLPTLSDAWELLQLVCLSVLLATLSAPEVTILGGRMVSRRDLSSVLARRLTSLYIYRFGTYVAVLAAGLGVTLGVLATVNSAVAAERLQQVAVAPPGFVGLDNDDAPSLPVPEEVVRAAEGVPALREQQPVQLWSTGRLGHLPDGKTLDVTDFATTPDNRGVVFAVSSPDDLARLFDRPLSRPERKTVAAGGMLVIDPETMVVGRSIALQDMSGQRSFGTLPAFRASVPEGPWFTFVPGFVLRSTAEELGIPVTRGALVYTDVSDEDARNVLEELTRAGINPENAEVHHVDPPVVPDGALVGACFLLLVVVTGVAMLISRSQIQGMRSWIHSLGRIGVPIGWVRLTLVRQHLVVTVTGVALGLLAAVCPLLLGPMFLPGLVIDVPWAVLAATTVGILVSCVGVAWVSVRGLGASGSGPLPGTE